MYDDAVTEIVNSELDRNKKAKQLRHLYTDARDQQRAASESAMIDMDGLNDRLRQIELAARELGRNWTSPRTARPPRYSVPRQTPGAGAMTFNSPG
ncbi:MAG: hypothetical protein H6891_03370 [Brucellaceae bacterium]|nr:hypothetical protein [Brucellaceae bacterium]